LKLVWTDTAYQRLLQIEEFIAQDDPVAAIVHTDRLMQQADKLTEFPLLGRVLTELPGSGLRELVMDNYRIVYRVHAQDVQVLTVFESHRLLPSDDLDPYYVNEPEG